MLRKQAESLKYIFIKFFNFINFDAQPYPFGFLIGSHVQQYLLIWYFDRIIVTNFKILSLSHYLHWKCSLLGRCPPLGGLPHYGSLFTLLVCWYMRKRPMRGFIFFIIFIMSWFIFSLIEHFVIRGDSFFSCWSWIPRIMICSIFKIRNWKSILSLVNVLAISGSWWCGARLSDLVFII